MPPWPQSAGLLASGLLFFVQLCEAEHKRELAARGAGLQAEAQPGEEG